MKKTGTSYLQSSQISLRQIYVFLNKGIEFQYFTKIRLIG